LLRQHLTFLTSPNNYKACFLNFSSSLEEQKKEREMKMKRGKMKDSWKTISYVGFAGLVVKLESLDVERAEGMVRC